jgi:hypothetical protein
MTARWASAASRPWRLTAALFLLALLAGPVAYALGEAIDEGQASMHWFGFLFLAAGLVLRPLGREAEALVLGIGQRPWLGGHLRRWKRLVLPYGTDAVIGLAFTCLATGAPALLASPAGWSALNVVAFGSLVVSGLLLGFAISRLIVGLLLIHRSGLWDARRVDWLIGGAVVASASIGNSVYVAFTTLQTAPGI